MNSVTKIGLLVSCAVFVPALFAQPSGRPSPMIREGIDESRLVTLGHNTRPEAIPANDRGRVADDFQMDHMLLQLKRSPERQTAVDGYMSQLHDPTSPNFHKWLTPEQFGQSYGLASADVETVSDWLQNLMGSRSMAFRPAD